MAHLGVSKAYLFALDYIEIYGEMSFTKWLLKKWSVNDTCVYVSSTRALHFPTCRETLPTKTRQTHMRDVCFFLSFL